MNLIVGGTGFIGGHLAEYFFQEGEISKGVFRKGSHLRILDQCGIQCIEGDLLDRETLHEPLDGVNTVYNLASPTPDHEGQGDYMEVNTKGLRNLLEESEEHGVKDFVHLSTLDVFGFKKKRIGATEVEGSPPHPYQRAKLEAEKLVREFSKRQGSEMRLKVVRAARATGPRDTTLALPLLRMMESGSVVIPSAGSPMSFTHPRDVAKALFKVATAGEGGKVYQVKSFDCTSDDLARSVVAACGRKVEVKHEGLLSKTSLPPYSASQIKAATLLEDQGSWTGISYSPEYDLQRTSSEIAEWHVKEPWLTESERA
ncbi:MAG TPA: NAD-dependent epimerase/dehydratase family protein [Nitrososphaerales archaeon]|nr:NAD-dependent epimerase/dehydratase family protein [Nitrososphaerales archaeon]